MMIAASRIAYVSEPAMFNSVKSCPASVSSVRPTPRFHQNHSIRPSDAGRRHASAGTTTNSSAIAAAMRKTVSMPRSQYMSEGREVVVIEIVENAPHRAAGYERHHRGTGQQSSHRRAVMERAATDEADRDVDHERDGHAVHRVVNARDGQQKQEIAHREHEEDVADGGGGEDAHRGAGDERVVQHRIGDALQRRENTRGHRERDHRGNGEGVAPPALAGPVSMDKIVPRVP